MQGMQVWSLVRELRSCLPSATVRESTCPPWPGTIVTTCMSYCMTGGPHKELGTSKPPPTRRVQERSKRDKCPATSQNPSHWHPSWLRNGCTTRKDSESEGLAKDNPEANPITIKPETASHMAEQFSWVPLPSYSPPRGAFSIKFLSLLACVSPWTIHFWVLDKSPRSDPFLQQCEHWTVT